MKKLTIILAIILGLNIFTFAQGGMLQRGPEPVQDMFGKYDDDGTPFLPTQHNDGYNQDADVPLGSGIFILLGLGAGYAIVGNKKKE